MDDALYERIFETTADPMFVAEVDGGEIVAANPAAAELVGRDRDEVVGSHFSAFHPPEERAVYERLFEEFVAEGQTTREGLHLTTADGERIPVEYSASVVEVDGRRLLQGTIRDVSDRRELEAQLRTERERYRRVFESSNDAIFVVDPESDEILDCNERACRLLGYDDEGLDGMAVSEIHPGEMERFRSFAAEVVDEGSGWTDELHCRTKHGDRVPAIVAASTVEWEGETAMLASVQDISEQKRRERSLDSLQETARRLLEARSREESARIAAEAVDEVLDTPYGTVWLRGDDGLDPVATTEEAAVAGLPSADDPDRYLSAAVSDSAGEVVEVAPPAEAADALETVLVAPLWEAGALSVGLTESTPAAATPRFVEILAANATAAIERSDREDDLRRVTEELTIINRVVRHDIRNDATLLIAELQRARAALDGLDGEVAERIDRALEDAEHVVDVTATVGDLVDVVTGDDDATESSVDLVATVRREVERARTVHPEAEIRLDVAADPTVAGTQILSSVVRNLLHNAVDHHDGEEPTVDVSVDTDHETATLRVADDGPGIPEDRRTELFDRGEQRLESSGLGLGLYLVERLTTRFGGEVEVGESVAGGAAFEVHLPLAEPAA